MMVYRLSSNSIGTCRVLVCLAGFVCSLRFFISAAFLGCSEDCLVRMESLTPSVLLDFALMWSRIGSSEIAFLFRLRSVCPLGRCDISGIEARKLLHSFFDTWPFIGYRKRFESRSCYSGIESFLEFPSLFRFMWAFLMCVSFNGPVFIYLTGYGMSVVLDR